MASVRASRYGEQKGTKSSCCCSWPVVIPTGASPAEIGAFVVVSDASIGLRLAGFRFPLGSSQRDPQLTATSSALPVFFALRSGLSGRKQRLIGYSMAHSLQSLPRDFKALRKSTTRS